MPEWLGKRTVVVVTACITREGMPEFAWHEIEVTQEEYENGIHYDRADDRLIAAGYEEPFVHFDEFETPAFLHPAARQHLGLPDIIMHEDQHAANHRSAGFTDR